MSIRPLFLIAVATGLPAMFVGSAAAGAEQFASYPPLRPLPTATNRPLTEGPARFVDPKNGDDRQEGTKAKPWKTVSHAVKQLQPGDTLYLRGGIYWERLVASPQGTADAPITVRSYPNELAILDGGHREFFEDPAKAWEPHAAGGDAEFRSTKNYPGVHVGGNFADSMVPLRMYGSFVDLRSAKETEEKTRDKTQPATEGTYVGPGIKRDETTGRIHVRLAHTTHRRLGDENYRGETDPRKLPLVIAGDGTALELRGARHVRVQDIVIRGATTAIGLTDSEAITLDGVTVYAVRYGMNVADVTGLKVLHCAFRGFDAPWHPRASGTDVDCFCPLDLVTIESGGEIEFANNEFTDHHDCIQLGDIKFLSFHHNLVERFNDDGIDLSLTEMGKYHIYANRIARCLTPISIHHGPTTSTDPNGVYFYRNVFDLRQGIYSHPSGSDDAASNDDLEDGFNRSCRLIGDHGGPIWPPIFFYHNTVLERHPSYRAYYGSGLGYAGLKQTKRRVFNNVFVHHRLGETKKGVLIAPKPAEVDLQIDGNLFWGLQDGTAVQENYFAWFRKSKEFETSKRLYPPGWTAHDLVADPQFQRISDDLKQPANLALRNDSPAVNAGVVLPDAWPDGLRDQDRASPDLGAISLGVEPWRIGIQGRLSVSP